MFHSTPTRKQIEYTFDESIEHYIVFELFFECVEVVNGKIVNNVY